MSEHTEALARVLHAMTDGLDGEGTATWPDPQHREVYALAVEEVAEAIASDPAPLLAALVEAGVLGEAHHGFRRSCGCFVTKEWEACCLNKGDRDNDVPVHCYTTGWNATR